MRDPARLRALHRPGRPLVLPNAWDAASARVVAEAGLPAVATTSGGVARALGFADGEQAPVDEMVAAVARITAAVDVPVTADFEGGYGLEPADVVARLVEAGASGLNFEDTDHGRGGALVDTAAQARRIAALRAAATGDADLVINARIDVFLQPGDPAGQLEDAIKRAQAYAMAGADCVFPILLTDDAAVGRLVEEAGAPVNVFVAPGGPPLARLAELGVARVSFGSGLMRLALVRAREAVEAVDRDDLSPFLSH